MKTICIQTENGVFPLKEAVIKLSRLDEKSYDNQRLHQFEYRPDTEPGLQAVYQLLGGKLGTPLVLLAGRPGLGKTHMCKGACWFWLGKGNRCIYYYVKDLIDDLKKGFKFDKHLPPSQTDPQAYSAVMNRVKSVPLLVLDDMAAHCDTDWIKSELEQIVNHRYENKLATIITTNELGKIPSRIIDRCREGRFVLLKGDSYRGTGKQYEMAGVL